MKEILDLIRSQRDYVQLSERLSEKRGKKLPLLVTQMCEGMRASFMAALIIDRSVRSSPALAILPDEKSIVRLAAALSDFGIKTKIYPVRDFVLCHMTASHELEHERLSVLYAVMTNDCDLVLTTPDAAVQYTMPMETLSARAFRIDLSEQVDTDRLKDTLLDCGYVPVSMVESQGQFSHRGDILDVFPPNMENPVRIELFGDEIDRMSLFDVMTQRRIDDLDEIFITPVREVIPDPLTRKNLAEGIKRLLKKSKSEKARQEYALELEELNSGRELLSVDKYLSYIYPQKQCLLDYFGENALLVVQDFNGVTDRLHSYVFQEDESFKSLLDEGLVDPEYSVHFLRENFFREIITGRRSVIVNSFMVSMGGMELGDVYTLKSVATPAYSDNLNLFYEDLDRYVQSGYKVRILCDGEQGAKNLFRELTDKGYPASIGEETAQIRLLCASSLPGFVVETSKFIALSVCKGSGVAGRKVKNGIRHQSKKISNTEKILSYTDLKEGDYVVHTVHGIGIYKGLESLNVGGSRRDFVKIQYAGTDLLYLPCNQLDTLSKYIGASEGTVVKLSKMGSGEWVRTTNKVKAATKEMAKELIQLYAARIRKKGFAFAKDDALDREFADTFEYDETKGQLDAIADIRRDMEADCPMDRLLCGDVGYGKTEVALRAAFKAVQSGKQVAILVPTTILALQHFQTVQSRMRGFPISADMLSRFRTAKQQEVTLRRLERGEVDIVIGTHRLLSKDVKFRALGLVIVDEEQRFGVAQKEKLKTLTENVDVLTLSATPIPRTMNMALSGIRDMSILEEAPGERFPVQSYVTEYNVALINEAIRRELRRGGQVFYLCNKIPHIPAIVARLSDAMPEARIGVGHGQMDKEELSDVWHSMIVGETDILVCTTIIETGVDVPNANTLIIENADQMGLSQLHQIRGRVGRSNRRAYAYFTYPEGKVLTEVAEKRLEAIRDFTEFGAGFRIAMRDLEIRGAGNILGADQHGHMETVGYDLYMKLLNEAILEEKGESVKKREECTVDFNVDAYIPEKYVENSNQRIEAYKKISLIRNDEDLYDIADELMDRYGEMPKAVVSLLHISLLRSLGSDCGIMKIQSKESGVLLYPREFKLEFWSRLAAMYNGKLLISLGNVPYVTVKPPKNAVPQDFTEKLLKDYLQILSEKDLKSS